MTILPSQLPPEDEKARATCWSITINNPTDSDTNVQMPARWRLEGQYERGEENGVLHLQAMLKTGQERFSAIKKVFPRAHILPARNVAALRQYVHKEDTRVAEFETKTSDIPNWYEYSNEIARRFDLKEYADRYRRLRDKDLMNSEKHGQIRLDMVDEMVAQDIESGRQGIEWIAVNPNFRQAWKKFGCSLAKREQAKEKAEEGSQGEDDETIDRS